MRKITLFITAILIIFWAGIAWANPPGNNGTVKIDGVEFDDHPNNEPHVGCIFQIDFYGYDEGNYEASVLLKLHPPTGRTILVEESGIFIGQDPAGGGADLDASRTYDVLDSLVASGAEPHPNQGYHIKLTVNAQGSIGADVKHKVFWVKCEFVAPSPTISPTISPTVSPTHKAAIKTINVPTKLAFTGISYGWLIVAALLLMVGSLLLRIGGRRWRE